MNHPTNPPAAPSGPYETEEQVFEVTRGAHGVPGGSTEYNHGRLLDTCKAAGVYLGAFDHLIVRWLAGWEPQTVAVVVGLITRAHAEGAQNVRTPDLEALSDDELIAQMRTVARNLNRKADLLDEGKAL